MEERHDKSRADITIQTNDAYFLIENKIERAAFRRRQIGYHAASGLSRAKRGSKQFHLVLLHPKSETLDDVKFPAAYHLCIIDWSDVLKILKQVVERKMGRVEPPGVAFLKVYIDFFERSVLSKWKGFNMSIITNEAITSAASYVARRDELLGEFQKFCNAVHSGLGHWRAVKPHEEKEKFAGWGPDPMLFRHWYDLGRGWRTEVDLAFYCTIGARSTRSLSLWIEFWTNEQRVMKRLERRGLSRPKIVRHVFGPRAELEVDGEGFWIGEEVPRSRWLNVDPLISPRALSYAQQRLKHYLNTGKSVLRGLSP